MALSFTPSFQYSIIDNISQLTITPDYSDYTDYDDLSVFSVEISTLTNGITATVDLFTTLVDATLTGTISVPLGSRTCTGVTTTFETDFLVGDYINGADDTDALYQIASITSDTVMTLESDCKTALTGSAYTKFGKTAYILPSTFGWSIIEDDIYTFTYSFEFNAPTSEDGSFIERKAFVTNCECYVMGKIKEIPNYALGDSCNCTYVDNVITAWMMLESIKYTSYNGSADYFTTIKSGMEELCEFDAYTSDTCNCNT